MKYEYEYPLQRAFSANRNDTLVLLREPSFETGYRDRLSRGDIIQTRLLYKCRGAFSQSSKLAICNNAANSESEYSESEFRDDFHCITLKIKVKQTRVFTSICVLFKFYHLITSANKIEIYLPKYQILST